MNKEFFKINRGDSKLISMYWFLILFIVAAGIVIIVGNFYGEPVDVREVEAQLMINKLADCVSSGGYLNEGVIGSSNLFKSCGFNFVEDEYYLEINFLDFESGGEEFSVSGGDNNLLDLCNKGKRNPVCIEQSFYSVDKSSREYEVKIKSGVRKTDKNVK